MDLPEKDKEILETILRLGPEPLNDFQIAFIRARRDYLNSEQRRVFASILGVEAPKAAVDEQPSIGHPEKTHFEKPANDPGSELPEAPQQPEGNQEQPANVNPETPAQPAGGESEQPETPENPEQPEEPNEPVAPVDDQPVDGATLPQTEEPGEEEEEVANANPFGSSDADPDAQQ